MPTRIDTSHGFHEGSHVEPTAEGDRPFYTLAEMLIGTTPEAIRAAFEWGSDVGEEAVE